MARFIVLALIPVAIASWAVKSVLVAALATRAPATASFIERWWTWVPLLVVIVALTFVHPLVGLAAVGAAYLFLTSTHAIGSPFRPRR
jgi:hypothetical protein